MSKTVAIIGGGLGGLFTGAILAKEGLHVTVVEKNLTIGGGLQCFRRFGEVFDTGMHVIGGMRRGGNIRKICDYLGILNEVRLRDVDDDCSDKLYFAEDKKYYTIAVGKTEFIESLANDFPDQRQNLISYVDAIFTLVDKMDMFFLRPKKSDFDFFGDDFIISASQFIAKYISDRRLRSILAYMNPFYSGFRDMTPAYVHAVISVLYINGASRFVDGSYLFAEALGGVIRNHGGEIIVNDGVVKVHTENKLITHIETKSGRHIAADHFISDIHPCTLFSLLDDESVLPKPFRSRLNSLPNSYSAFTLSIKLKPGRIRYFNYSGYYMTEYDKVWSFGDEQANWPLGFLYMTPPVSNQGDYSRKMIVTAPMPWSMVSRWEDSALGNRPEEYNSWKEQCAEKLLSMIEEIIPDFRDCIENINLASPLTIRDYYGAKEGGMCGFAKDCNNLIVSQIPVVTKVSNLLLTGQNNNLHGFCGVPLTAINTCEAILGQNYLLNKLNDYAG